MSSMQPGFFTIDVEDYYHFISASTKVKIADWDKMPSRVENGMEALFELLASHDTKATCFFLGYIAKRNPILVRKAIDLGHEVAAHGMYHQVVSGMSRAEFRQEIIDTRKCLEDLTGTDVKGWRAAGFHLNSDTRWYFETLAESGIQYDSSLLPNRRKHQIYGPVANQPYRIDTSNGAIWEFPITVAEFPYGIKFSMFGGVYLRFFPKTLIEQMAKKHLAHSPLTIYIHPREMDSRHPRLQMNPILYAKSYLNLNTVKPKLDTLLQTTNFITMGRYITI